MAAKKARLGYGDLIAKYRDMRGITQAELADELHVKHTTVSNWEREAVRPNIDQGNDLIVALHMPAPAFWLSMGARMAASTAMKTIPDTIIERLLEVDPRDYRDIERQIYGVILSRREGLAGTP